MAYVIKLAIYSLIILSLTSLSASAKELLVVTEEWKPYNFTNDKGEVVGRATKKVREVLAVAEIDYEIKVYPWVRAMKIAKERPNTMIYSIYRTAEREADYEWACPLIRPVGVYFFKLKTRKDIQVASLEDAKQYTSAVVKGNIYYDFLIQHGFTQGDHLVVAADSKSFYKLFFKGRIDLVMSTEYIMSEELKAAGLNDEEVTPLLEVTKASQQRGCMAFSKDTDPMLIDRIRRALVKHNQEFVGP